MMFWHILSHARDHAITIRGSVGAHRICLKFPVMILTTVPKNHDFVPLFPIVRPVVFVDIVIRVPETQAIDDESLVSFREFEIRGRPRNDFLWVEVYRLEWDSEIRM